MVSFLTLFSLFVLYKEECCKLEWLYLFFPKISSISFRFLHNMNVEARVRALLQRLEVSVDGVLGPGPEGVPDHVGEVLQGVGIVGQPKQNISLLS